MSLLPPSSCKDTHVYPEPGHVSSRWRGAMATTPIKHCFEVAVTEFQSRVAANPYSKTLYFMSLMIPGADTGQVGEHFVVYDSGYIIDPTMINLKEKCVGGSMKLTDYLEQVELGAKWFNIQAYNSKLLFLNPDQFDIFLDVMNLTAKISTSTTISLSLIRESIVVLLDVWDKHETNKKLAVVEVMKRLHDVSIEILAPGSVVVRTSGSSAAGKNATTNAL